MCMHDVMMTCTDKLLEVQVCSSSYTDVSFVTLSDEYGHGYLWFTAIISY